jgi:hypothetical protein
MVISENQLESTGGWGACGSCQHSIEVRGMKQIVCLAYLVVRQEMKNDCDEFEPKRTAAATGD